MAVRDDNNNVTFLNVSKGRIVNPKANINGSSVDGQLLRIRFFVDQYEGKPIEKIEIDLHDETEGKTYRLRITDQTYAAWNFYAAMAHIDPTLPLKIRTYASKQNEKVSFIILNQGGKDYRWVEDYPKANKVGRNGELDFSPLVKNIMNDLSMLLLGGVEVVREANHYLGQHDGGTAPASAPRQQPLASAPHPAQAAGSYVEDLPFMWFIPIAWGIYEALHPMWVSQILG